MALRPIATAPLGVVIETAAWPPGFPFGQHVECMGHEENGEIVWRRRNGRKLPYPPEMWTHVGERAAEDGKDNPTTLAWDEELIRW